MANRGRREFIMLCSLAILLQVATGVVALLQGAPTIPWRSLVWRPLVIVPFFFLVPLLGRRAAILLSAWLGYLALAYIFGVMAARTPVLKFMRGIACLDLAASTIWLQASPHIRAYLRSRDRRSAAPPEPFAAGDVRPE